MGFLIYSTALLTAIVSKPDNKPKSNPVNEGPPPTTKHISLFDCTISDANFIGGGGARD